MSTCVSVPSINDPVFQEPLPLPDPPSPIQSPQALRLLAHSLDAKARAHEDCEQFVYVYRCPNGHIWPVPITCHQRFCPMCSERIAKRMVKKYDAIEIGCDSFLSIEISQLGEVSPDFVKTFNAYIGRGFKWLERSSESRIGTIWNDEPTPGKLTAHLLLWGDGSKSLERYREAWPRAIVKVSVRPAHQFHSSLHYIFERKVSKDPAFRADCEYAFHGRRSVHTMGHLHLKPQTTLDAPESPEGVEELFPSEPSTGNNVPTCKGHKCPKCQEPATMVTGRMSGAAFRHPTLGYHWWDNYKTA